MKIVLVADDEAHAIMTKSWLRRLGIFVDLATNGEKAVELIERCGADLVVMDLHSSVRNALQTAQRIRGSLRVRRQPVIYVLSDGGFTAVETEPFEGEVDGFWT